MLKGRSLLFPCSGALCDEVGRVRYFFLISNFGFFKKLNFLKVLKIETLQIKFIPFLFFLFKVCIPDQDDEPHCTGTCQPWEWLCRKARGLKLTFIEPISRF